MTASCSKKNSPCSEASLPAFSTPGPPSSCPSITEHPSVTPPIARPSLLPLLRRPLLPSSLSSQELKSKAPSSPVIRRSQLPTSAPPPDLPTSLPPLSLPPARNTSSAPDLPPTPSSLTHSHSSAPAMYSSPSSPPQPVRRQAALHQVPHLQALLPVPRRRPPTSVHPSSDLPPPTSISTGPRTTLLRLPLPDFTTMPPVSLLQVSHDRTPSSGSQRSTPVSITGPHAS